MFSALPLEADMRLRAGMSECQPDSCVAAIGALFNHLVAINRNSRLIVSPSSLAGFN